MTKKPFFVADPNPPSGEYRCHIKCFRQPEDFKPIEYSIKKKRSQLDYDIILDI